MDCSQGLREKGTESTLYQNPVRTGRAGLSKRGARLEALLRGPTQWRVQKFLRRRVKSYS